MNRWLWGLLILGMVASFGRVHGKPGVGSPTPVLIPPFAAPATMPALGEELARGLYAALREANIPARLGKGEDSSAIVGRLEELSQTQVRLQASYRGHSVQSVGDLEHLDDLVYAVFTQLRPRLQAATAGDPRALDPSAPGNDPSAPVSLPPPPTVSPASPTLKESGKESASAARPVSVKVPGSTAAKVVHTSRPVETRPEPPATPIPTKEPVMASSPPSLPSPPMVPADPGTGPEASSHLPKNPSVLVPRPPPAPFTLDPRRPRIAVHVIGDPVARIPAGYSGLGTVGQQSLIGYLQQRLRLPAVASRLSGLTGGLEALDQSLRVGARHTLMVRLDSLALAPSPTSPMMGGSAYAGGTLSGRIHIVLLHDGKLSFDRSVMLPPTLVLAAESPAQVYARSLVTALDSVAGELAGRIAESQSSATSHGAPGSQGSPRTL